MIVCPNCKAQNRDTAQFCRQCGAELVQVPVPGIVLGGEYRVAEVIKPGGMGTVYKAESGGKLYAVKEMRDTFTNPKDRQDAINRFMAEALILARLSHPHIPKVHRHFIENDRYYLVMDFVEGEDFEAVLDHQGGKGLPEEQVLTWALQLCAVLEYLHGQTPPVIFRDLKPANIMLKPSGDISLIDFGIAKLFNPAQQGTLIGTPGYAAPEQYQGLAEPRSDIFALGATLHHLLTGRDPKKHLPFTFPPLRSLNPATLSVGIESIVAKAVALDSKKRYQSIREMREALRNRRDGWLFCHLPTPGWNKRMPTEKPIDAADLMQRLEHILDDIQKHGVVYIVKVDAPLWNGDSSFVLGPPRICAHVLGLIDAEYGWPATIEIESINSVWDMAPGHRRHPFIFRGYVCLAGAVYVNEYQMIKTKLGSST